MRSESHRDWSVLRGTEPFFMQTLAQPAGKGSQWWAEGSECNGLWLCLLLARQIAWQQLMKLEAPLHRALCLVNGHAVIESLSTEDR